MQGIDRIGDPSKVYIDVQAIKYQLNRNKQ